jgi:thiol-disulfide isomerase/thioredoxin
LIRVLALVLLALASAAGGYFLYLSLGDGAPEAGEGFPPLPPPPEAAQTAPEFVLPDIEGEQRSSAEWHDTLRVVNFWATWCPPCVREIPLLLEIQDEYRDRDVRIIGIAIDEAEAVADFATRFEFNYPVLVGQEEAMELANRFVNGFIGLPFTVFTDRDGNIIRVHTGEIHRDQIEAILAELL